ncbi:hypothetical protein KDA_61000 [Dictyobacter alpinus]|uniref:Luciferase-like domain-containing protein n=1 Tax=Dictyobacter alpinus TaxID=2014873 RepID=A0A402BGZ5_9CHLR|nr:LLM class flavin-dependent oxidoreductase [Dictyobacter alpinus]GCE30616.1 hypothetical protein KDA_61000 [Dictyobacter alpinus]
MQYGLYMPNLSVAADPRLLIELAQEAEVAGWDGFFLWDHISLGLYEMAVVDPWIVMAGIASHTKHIRFGPLVTPLPRRRPWMVAREALALDHLSNGRFILGVGVGNEPFSLDNFGEETDIKRRAAMTDEALDILVGLWSGKPFNYTGSYYQVKDTVFLPAPVHPGGIPIWVAATWPHKAPMRRAARWDGVVPSAGNVDKHINVATYREFVTYIREQQATAKPFDFLYYGTTTGDDPGRDADTILPLADAGMTWWLEDMRCGADLEQWNSIDASRNRIRKGPPRL